MSSYPAATPARSAAARAVASAARAAFNRLLSTRWWNGRPRTPAGRR
jgi:hypothetical protein